MDVIVLKKFSIFYWGNNEDLYEQVIKEMDYITLLIPFKMRKNVIIQSFLQDLWLFFFEPSPLIENAENAMIFQVRKNILLCLKAESVIHKGRHVTEADSKCSYMAAVFVVKLLMEWFEEIATKNKEFREVIDYLEDFATINIKTLFEPRFRTIEPYPKEFAYRQAALVKVIRRTFEVNDGNILERLKKVLDEAILLHRNLHPIGGEAYGCLADERNVQSNCIDS